MIVLLHQLLQPLNAFIQRRLHARRCRRESLALMGLAQHELNDLAVGQSELPGLLGDPSLKPYP